MRPRDMGLVYRTISSDTDVSVSALSPEKLLSAKRRDSDKALPHEIYCSDLFGLTRSADAERAEFRLCPGVASKLPVMPCSRIHLTWASYFSARDLDTSAGLALVGTEASTKLPLNFVNRRKNIDLFFF